MGVRWFSRVVWRLGGLPVVVCVGGEGGIFFLRGVTVMVLTD